MELSDFVFALNQAARIGPCLEMTEPDVARERAEERDPLSDEHRDASNDETLNESGAQEALNGDPAVDVGMVRAGGGKFRNDVRGRSTHLFHPAAAHAGKIEGTAAENDHALVTVGPGVKGQNGLEGFAADDDGVDAGDELVVAMGFAAARREKIESAVGAGDETVEAGADEDGELHERFPRCGR